MWVQLKMRCVVCVCVTERHNDDGCDLASTLCKYDLRKSDLRSEFGKSTTSEAGKYHFRAANMLLS